MKEDRKLCGIKSSKCKDVVSEDRIEENTFSKQFTFVDLVDGTWSIDRTDLYESNPVIQCPINGTVIFHYPRGTHDVIKLKGEAHYESCDLTDSIELSPRGIQDTDKYDYVTYYHHCTTPGALEYLSCSLPFHCQAGQKISILTSDSVNVYDENNESIMLHVEQFSRILTAMGHSIEPDSGFVQMPTGYQTEEIAEKTKEWIWCGLEHCPEFYDLVVDGDSTEEDCTAAGNVLLGFIDRNKPIPDFNNSEKYYEEAIESGGINECAARSYKSKMFLDKKEYENANVTAVELCQVCGNGNFGDLHGASVRQAKSEFDVMDPSTVIWPCPEPEFARSASSRPIVWFDSSVLFFVCMINFMLYRS